MKSFYPIFFAVTLLLSGCAAGVDEEMDEARFALDAGDYATAITKAQAAFDADGTNVDAAMLLSAAYALRAGVELIDIADDLMDLAGTSGDTNGGNDFSAIRNAMAGIFTATTSLGDLRTAITKMEAVTAPAATHPLYKSYYFQLGLLETLEAFSLPSLKAKPATTASTTDTYDVSQITETHRTNVENDFLNADDHMVNAGLGDKDITEALRQNYYGLKNIATADDSTKKFTLNQLKDLIACQLDRDETPAPNDGFLVLTLCADVTFLDADGSTNTQ